MSEKLSSFPNAYRLGRPIKELVLPRLWHVILLTLMAIACLGIWLPVYPLGNYGVKGHRDRARCPQMEPIFPTQSGKKLSEMDDLLKSFKFRNESIPRLSGAIQIPSISYDDLGPIGEDARWDVFYEFADYLKQTFPLTHGALDLEAVNVHGLLYTWKGSNSSLKPTLLMAHQDVVPVPESTIPQWTHPPFDGAYDGKYIWGRGSFDCKSQLIAILESIELLVAAGFRPTRTVILSFGFDEEASGEEGAGHLARFLEDRYGKDSFAVIVDEGSGFQTLWGTTFATPGVGEKGLIDVEIFVRMPGGHSSVPPLHNGIGVMSELVRLIEAHPYEPRLYEANPFLGLLQCGAEHSSDFPSKLKKLLYDRSKKAGGKKDRLALEASEAGPAIKYLMTTSVAVDIIQGGVKVNALPERTTATVDYRINVGERAEDVKTRIKALAKVIADKYNLTLNAFDGTKETPSSITLLVTDAALEPAPATPISIQSMSAYSILSGTTKALYGDNIVVAPGMDTGNTDTKFYWNLSRHIFRFVPGWDPESEGSENTHTVDERISAKAHVANIQWFSLFIRNMDEAELS